MSTLSLEGSRRALQEKNDESDITSLGKLWASDYLLRHI